MVKFIALRIQKGQREGPVAKGACNQAWPPKMDARPHAEEGENWFLQIIFNLHACAMALKFLNTHIHLHAHTHSRAHTTHTHTYMVFMILKTLDFKNFNEKS